MQLYRFEDSAAFNDVDAYAWTFTVYFYTIFWSIYCILLNLPGLSQSASNFAVKMTRVRCSVDGRRQRGGPT